MIRFVFALAMVLLSTFAHADPLRSLFQSITRSSDCREIIKNPHIESESYEKACGKPTPYIRVRETRERHSLKYDDEECYNACSIADAEYIKKFDEEYDKKEKERKDALEAEEQERIAERKRLDEEDHQRAVEQAASEYNEIINRNPEERSDPNDCRSISTRYQDITDEWTKKCQNDAIAKTNKLLDSGVLKPEDCHEWNYKSNKDIDYNDDPSVVSLGSIGTVGWFFGKVKSIYGDRMDIWNSALGREFIFRISGSPVIINKNKISIGRAIIGLGKQISTEQVNTTIAVVNVICIAPASAQFQLFLR